MATERTGRRRRFLTVAAVVLGVLVVAVVAGLIAARLPSTEEAQSETTAPSDSPSPSSPSVSPTPTASGSSTGSLSPGDHTITVESGGRSRTLILHVPPAADKGGALPLLLVYHGALDTAAATESSTDFNRVADERGMYVAYLQGYQDTWNEGAGHTPAEVAGVDDVAFTKDALAAIEGAVDVDRTRVGATGLSNGALMTQLLGCRLADRLHVIIPVAGPLPVSIAKTCAPSRPVSVLEVHGTADESIPYDGGGFAGVGGGTTVLSAPDSVARWASLNHCSSTGATTSAGSVRTTSYPRCAAGATVALRTLVGGGHGWPGDIGELAADALMQ